MNHAIDLAVGCHYFLPGLQLLPLLSSDGATCKRQHTSDSSLLLIYRPRNDERLSWPSWLTCSGWLTHISGHPSAAGQAQDRESSPARDRRSTTVPRHQLSNGTKDIKRSSNLQTSKFIFEFELGILTFDIRFKFALERMWALKCLRTRHDVFVLCWRLMLAASPADCRGLQ